MQFFLKAAVELSPSRTIVCMLPAQHVGVYSDKEKQFNCINLAAGALFFSLPLVIFRAELDRICEMQHWESVDTHGRIWTPLEWWKPDDASQIVPLD